MLQYERQIFSKQGWGWGCSVDFGYSKRYKYMNKFSVFVLQVCHMSMDMDNEIASCLARKKRKERKTSAENDINFNWVEPFMITQISSKKNDRMNESDECNVSVGKKNLTKERLLIEIVLHCCRVNSQFM